MALDFPTNPTSGQIYDNYYWDQTAGVWNSLGNYAIPNLLSNATFTSSGSSVVPLTVKGAPSQAANLQEWRNASGIVLSSMSASGGLTLNNALTVANGGTGAASLTSGGYLRGNGTSAVQSQTGIPAEDISSGTLARARIPSANYAVSNATAITVATATPTTIASCTLTTTGKPVLITATGDMNPTTAAPNWNNLQLYRDGNQIGKRIICESTGNSVNNPWSLVFIDAPAAGTYAYNVRAWQGAGTQVYGETGDIQAPQIIAVELL